MLSKEDKKLYDTDVLARTLYGEARGEFYRPDGGMSALISVANVVVNRTKIPHRFGSTLSDVCLRPYQFSCWNANDPNYLVISSVQLRDNSLFDLCWEVAEKVAQGAWPDLTQGSDHYYAVWLSRTPEWAQRLKPQARIGQHIFFKLYSPKEN